MFGAVVAVAVDEPVMVQVASEALVRSASTLGNEFTDNAVNS